MKYYFLSIPLFALLLTGCITDNCEGGLLVGTNLTCEFITAPTSNLEEVATALENISDEYFSQGCCQGDTAYLERIYTTHGGILTVAVCNDFITDCE